MPNPADRRRWIRYAAHSDTICCVTHLEWAGPLVSMPVRNVSVNGAEILADRFLNPGMQIDIELASETNKVTCRRRASVRFCLKGNSFVYRVGLRFGENLSVREVEGLGTVQKNHHALAANDELPPWYRLPLPALGLSAKTTPLNHLPPPPPSRADTPNPGVHCNHDLRHD